MAELWHMDLKGAPYAYTPFCDNKEMEGYRFWKQGSHLAGRPYHISCTSPIWTIPAGPLAIDRAIYEQLSKDLLANLDQDLPNYAQHQVPASRSRGCGAVWCGNETKAAAKTRDLCNNP